MGISEIKRPVGRAPRAGPSPAPFHAEQQREMIFWRGISKGAPPLGIPWGITGGMVPHRGTLRRGCSVVRILNTFKPYCSLSLRPTPLNRIAKRVTRVMQSERGRAQGKRHEQGPVRFSPIKSILTTEHFPTFSYCMNRLNYAVWRWFGWAEKLLKTGFFQWWGSRRYTNLT